MEKDTLCRALSLAGAYLMVGGEAIEGFGDKDIEPVGAKVAYIEPASPWENGYVESFNARFRDELLNGEIFHS